MHTEWSFINHRQKNLWYLLPNDRCSYLMFLMLKSNIQNFWLNIQENIGSKIPVRYELTRHIMEKSLLIFLFMGVDNAIAMVLLLVFCLFGIATTTKGTSFTIATNYLSNFLQFDSDNQSVVNINYNQFCYGISS